MKNGIIIAHGPLGNAFIEAAKCILGTDEGLYALSVTEMSNQEIAQRLQSLTGSFGPNIEGTVIMACLRGGSSWNISASVIQNNDRVRLISGCNLAMVLSFMTHRDKLPLDELVETIRKQAVDGIVVFKN